MHKKAKVLHELFTETLTRLDTLNVGKSAGYQNHRKTNGKAEGESQPGQQLS